MIIGAMKSGTTSLFDALATHPKIAPSDPKEPEFFSENLRNRPQRSEDYLSLWSPTAIQAGDYLLEASTGYTKWPFTGDVAQRIRDHGLRPKMIYLVRDPVDRVESHINFALNKAWFEPHLSFDDDRYLRASKYYTQLSRYEDAFKRGDLLVVDFEDLKNNIGHVLSRIARFLELEDAFDIPSLVVSNKTEPLSVAERFVYCTPLLQTAFWATPPRARSWVQKAMRLAPKADKVRLTETQKRSIREQLYKDIQRFGETYLIDVSKWGF